MAFLADTARLLQNEAELLGASTPKARQRRGRIEVEPSSHRFVLFRALTVDKL